MRVSICIATVRREDGLLQLLDSLAALEDVDVELAIWLIDNSGEEAGEVSLEDGYPWPVTCVREHRRGIPFARNLALSKALPESDVICFVDDDEVVSPGWLRELLDHLFESGAGVVTGPVVAQYGAGTSPAIMSARPHDRARYPTGTRRPAAATHNVAVRSGVFERVTPWFDEQLARVGGSDTEYFRRVAAAGFRIEWVDTAVVYERVPAERATLKWLVRRRFRVGSIDGWLLRREGRRRAVFVGGARAVARVLSSFALVIPGVVAPHRGLPRLLHGVGGLGVLFGLLGFRCHEYDGQV